MVALASGKDVIFWGFLEDHSDMFYIHKEIANRDMASETEETLFSYSVRTLVLSVSRSLVESDIK